MKSISILLSTYNGSKYIKKQIVSVLQQKGVQIRLFIRDDGSVDDTKSIITDFAEKDSRIRIFLENNIGYTKSFMRLCQLAKNSSDYYAFCDQDDVWLPDKLLRAITRLENISNNYKLYFSGLTMVDGNLNKIGTKYYKIQDVNLGSAMVRNSVAGCTMVFNNNLNNLNTSSNIVNKLIGHDAWIFRLNLAVDGATVYDDQSFIYFRRYGTNTTSSGTITLSRILKELSLNREQSLRYETARILVDNFSQYITSDNLLLLASIASYRDSIRARIKLLFNSKLHYSFFPVVFICKLQILFCKY
ncbi:glycosyltransferase [Lactiplantibacillus plantarum]|uniref:glycosyltransferase n=1 Tax=Lactiplantibacillus plantarum TaxID=1590 RepID=UPI003F52955B